MLGLKRKTRNDIVMHALYEDAAGRLVEAVRTHVEGSWTYITCQDVEGKRHDYLPQELARVP